MDSNYLFAVLSFLVGLAAGYQGIYERYQKDSPQASVTLWGILYLLTRAALPAATYTILYHYRVITTMLWLQAIAYGVGVEAILRSRFYVGQIKKEEGGVEEIIRGPLDLLRWYQDLFLTLIDDSRARARKEYVMKNLPKEKSFLELCDSVLNHIYAYKQANPDIIPAVNKLRSEFSAKRQSATQETDLKKLDEAYRMKLGYRIYHLAGEKAFKTFFS